MKIKLYMILLAGLLAILVSCNSKIAKIEGLESVNNPLSNSSTPIPKLSRKDKIFLASINERLEGTGFENLRYSNLSPNTIEIRVWAGFDTSPLRAIFVRKNGEEFSAEFVPPLYPITIPPDLKKLPNPKSGWNQLFKKIEDSGLMNFEDPNDIPMIDEGGVLIEIKTANDYRTMDFPGVLEKSHGDYKKVREICETLETEFGVDLLRFYGFEKN
jgi:hypothetical protein